MGWRRLGYLCLGCCVLGEGTLLAVLPGGHNCAGWSQLQLSARQHATGTDTTGHECAGDSQDKQQDNGEADTVCGESGMTEKIEFAAEVYKVQTLVDHGIRITLDLPESSIPQAAMLMECRRQGIPLKFMAKVSRIDGK